ncbi:MAG: TolC family protein, partial [Planctomycetota bacterium]
ATGCTPTQPFFFHEDGDLSHYLHVATEIEYPDVEEPSLDEVTGALRPLTLKNPTEYDIWDLSLEDATRITLCNSNVMRQIGGVVAESAPETISRTLISSVAVTTTYDPALTETSAGTASNSAFNATGVEAALAEFDASIDASVTWDKGDQPQNRPPAGFGAAFSPGVFGTELGNATLGVSKTYATGGQWGLRNNTAYTSNNIPSSSDPADGAFQSFTSAWETNFEAFFSQPLFQGRGAQYNRIAGVQDFNQAAANFANPFNGVMIARINTDQSLADFEGGVRNLVRDVEQAYWSLYFAYRDLDARKLGRDSSLETWKKVSALFKEGARGGSADREAQARAQYFQFQAQVEQGLTDLFRAENRLRYVMGLAVSDGRLIRPADEPAIARIDFDWSSIHGEAVARRVEVRRQKWQIKRRELELIAARNHLLPRVDAFGTYRWRGLGDQLIDSDGFSGLFNEEGSDAFSTLTSGDFQEWQLGLQASIPLGFRQQLSTVRHHQLLLARERALLQDLELEVSHQLGDALRDLDLNYGLTETNFNRRAAAQREVEAVQAAYEADRVTLDLLLDAQSRRADAESAYYRSLVDYNLAIADVHFRKGSLLDYNGVVLAEGPWPGKAHFDALRLARRRDASMYLDYGYTRPSVISRGPTVQGAAVMGHPHATPYEGVIINQSDEDGEVIRQPISEEELVQPQSPTPIDQGTSLYREPPLPSAVSLAPPRRSPDDPSGLFGGGLLGIDQVAFEAAADRAAEHAADDETQHTARNPARPGARRVGNHRGANQPRP